MSSQNTTMPVQNPPGSASKSKRKNKKKKAPAAKSEGAVDSPSTNGPAPEADEEVEEGEEEDESPSKPEIAANDQPAQDQTLPDTVAPSHQPHSKSNGTTHAQGQSGGTDDWDDRYTATTADGSDTSQRLEALAKERDSLRNEVVQLRRSLEDIQSKHEEETQGLEERLQDSNSGKEHAEGQYRNLLGNINKIKAQLGERMKADAEELNRCREQIDDLETHNRTLAEENEEANKALESLHQQHEQQASEVDTLRGRASLSQQNWIKERDELIHKEAFARDEFETARQAMQDWEVLAMEERSLRENLSERVSELEEQVSSTRQAYERAAEERDTQSQTVDGLQRALQDIQDARKRELREMVETNQAQLEQLRKQLQAAEEAATSAKSTVESTQKELERLMPFEKEVKEKKLLIGKLRHEAVILNDHLTKALRILKKGKPEDNVDRQIVTNHLLHFLALDRSDPKKFQVLQLIAALLGWTDEQREQAGLSRPGGMTGSLRIPMSPFRRTPSTPSLNSDHPMMNEGSNSKESLAELWSNFLEQEAEVGSSRRGSTATVGSRPSIAGLGIQGAKSPPAVPEMPEK